MAKEGRAGAGSISAHVISHHEAHIGLNADVEEVTARVLSTSARCRLELIVGAFTEAQACMSRSDRCALRSPHC